ncbi:metalloendoproteinase 4-MMP-like isoform X2 [Lotus japonicus]|uniref:metalloendoproteinase 4-MMP-like isoform X2 n=1 Tax=Lotus japonicus TaxID=34305 RepID=UPI00258994A1|nr:metalloendoproteinase 4-MMP-like isoform X2 [Lotus japonicus]
MPPNSPAPSIMFHHFLLHSFTLFSTLLLIISHSHIVSETTQLSPPATKINITNHNLRSFNNAARGTKITAFESALIRYQQKLGLQVTGKLDSKTVSQMITPRCGVPDTTTTRTTHTSHSHLNNITQHFVYFPGKPRWSRDRPMRLTYAFSREYTIHTLTHHEIRRVFKRAFSRWALVIPVSFAESADYDFADIRIGFYSGDHGDGEPFDGVLGVLAHSFSPEIGRLHLDAAETWAVDFAAMKSLVAVDLESVATHEIGHLLGLSHSSVKEAVMYPSLRPRDKRADLNIDDVKGVQSLYGLNRNFRSQWALESVMSVNHGVKFGGKAFMLVTALIIVTSSIILRFQC